MKRLIKVMVIVIVLTFFVSAATYNFVSNSDISLFNITSEGNVFVKSNLTVGDTIFGKLDQATNYYPTSINLTTATYTGSFVDGGNTGYAAGNSICNTEFSGHLCDQSEVTQWFANTATGLNGDAWVSAGGPKFVPATVPVNDCNGFTHGTADTYLGNYWHFSSTTGGDPRAINCGSTLSIACCVY